MSSYCIWGVGFAGLPCAAGMIGHPLPPTFSHPEHSYPWRRSLAGGEGRGEGRRKVRIPRNLFGSVIMLSPTESFRLVPKFLETASSHLVVWVGGSSASITMKFTCSPVKVCLKHSLNDYKHLGQVFLLAGRKGEAARQYQKP